MGAGRLVEELEASGKWLHPRGSVSSHFFCQQPQGDQALERIKRISRAFNDSLEELQSAVSGPWHLESFDGEGHRVEFNVSEGMLRVVSVSEHADADIEKMFAALCEVDLLLRHTERSLQTVQVLGQQRPDENLWLAIKDSEKQDNLMLASYVDALDEECAMLWVSVKGQTVKGGEMSLHGVPLPRELDGYRRTKAGDALYSLTPLRHTSRSGEPPSSVVRLIAIHSMELSQISKLYYSVNRNGWLSRRYFLNQMAAFVSGVKTLARSETLESRLEESARAPFYAQVKRHLDSQHGIIGG